MPTVKGKSCSAGQRYTPVSEFDDATLAQKREYWRKKKREQRARRSEKQDTSSKPSLNTLAHVSSFPLHHKTTNLPANIVRSLQTGNGTLASCQTQQFQHNSLPITSKIEVKCMPQINKTINSALISQLNSSSSVPPLTKRHSPQPRVSAQIPPVPNSHNPRISVFIQPKTTANIATVSSPCGIKSTPQLATKSALATQQKPTNSSTSPAKVETEEEKAAKRRELWRIKKREQRAKLADRLGKTKTRAQNVQKQHSGNAASVHIPSPSSTQPGSSIQKIQTNMAAPFQTAPSLVVVKRPFEPLRKSPSPFHLSGVMRARCPTPWQNLIKQKLLKLKSPSLSYLYGGRSLPQIEPSDTPEQVISKRREYWRVKKREQRAKLSVEVKSRLKEKADLQRRVKRYHKILEDMRKARSQAIMHASETIGGFIKEDGTVTINIPQVTVNFSAPAHRGERVDKVGTCSTQPQVSQFNLQPPLPHPVPAKMTMGQQANKQQTRACSNVQVLPIQTQGSHLMLTHPPTLSTGATTGGCVMKMAVSCKAPALTKAYLDPSLTAEERMAKKREYWRTKKREQRAARAVRLRQGLSQARASAVLLKRKAQKHVTSVSLSKRLPKQPGIMTNNNMAYVNEMKQVGEFVPAVDLNLNLAICPELKPPMSRTPPPAQADPDPALSADSQATTLLAVASMKKLLEESLSSVSECQPETEIKTETEEEKLEEDIKPDVSQVDVCAPITADVMIQTDTQINEHASFETEDLSQITPSCAPHCPSESSTQTPSSFIVHPKIEASECPQRRTQRTKKAGQQHCCSPEPHKLHHPPIEMHVEVQEQHQSRAKCPQVMPCGLNSLQQKREYWKMMKRQQRARLKARQRSSSNMTSHRNVQSAGSGCSLNKTSAMKPALLPKPSAQSGAALTNMPTVLLVSPSASNAGPQSTLRVKSPVSSRDSDTDTRIKSENRIINIPPLSLPALKPPDNPLSSVNSQPPEPQSQNTSRNLSSITIPYPPKQNNACPVKSVSTLVPPKPIPGESDEDFQKRKREYWRIKKKEQRARKAFQDKDKSPKQSCSQTLSQEPLQVHCEQEDDWMTPSLSSEDPVNHSADSDGGSFSFPSYPVPLDGVYGDYEGPSCEDGALSGDFWRNHYLMDYDPLNQLLVCMVCGDLQYVHNLEAVRGHIEEAHPHTLSLESGERCRILQAWDEQMFHRERFFTNQLQQHSASMTEAHMN